VCCPVARSAIAGSFSPAPPRPAAPAGGSGGPGASWLAGCAFGSLPDCLPCLRSPSVAVPLSSARCSLAQASASGKAKPSGLLAQALASGSGLRFSACVQLDN
jgi:hypothetical protein